MWPISLPLSVFLTTNYRFEVKTMRIQDLCGFGG